MTSPLLTPPPTLDEFLKVAHKTKEIFGEYDQLTTAEPVTQLLEPGVAWVVKGRHGPTLVSKNMLILDVDEEVPLEDFRQEDDSQLRQDVFNDLEDVSMPGDCFRIYRTFKGLRLIYTGEVTSGDEFKRLLDRFAEPAGTDRRYLFASRMRSASQARLKPKSPEFRREYLDQDLGKGPRRACKYIGSFGSGTGVMPTASIAAQIRFHDEETEAFNNSKELY